MAAGHKCDFRPKRRDRTNHAAAKLLTLPVLRVVRRRLTGLALLFAFVFTGSPAALRGDDSPPGKIACKVDVFGPSLDFELRFFVGFRLYTASAPLAGPNRLFALRVLITPLDLPDVRPSLFERNFTAGPIPPGRNEFQLRDSFAVGPGRYKVQWILVDSSGPSCYVEREIQAELRKKDSDLPLRAQPGEVVDSRLRLFRPERAIVGDGPKAPLRIKVFLNLDVPATRGRTQIRMWELMPRFSALRALSRHPRIGGLSMVAYSVEEQAVIARHGLQDSFDYRALRSNLDDLDPGFVSIDQLERDSDLAFFNEMLVRELPGDETVDAYIFLGPDVFVRKNREKELLESIGQLPEPVFFLADGRAPWKGLVGKAVSFFQGKTFRFYDPSQMAESVEKIVQELDATE